MKTQNICILCVCMFIFGSLIGGGDKGHAAADSAFRGRYQIYSVVDQDEKSSVLLDTETGESWEWSLLSKSDSKIERVWFKVRKIEKQDQ